METAKFLLAQPGPVAVWRPEELARWSVLEELAEGSDGYELKFSKYNPTPGTGRTGFQKVPPNPFPFYGEGERYTPAMQPDGGQLSEWRPQYAPSREQAEADRAAAYAAGVPHGYVPGGEAAAGASADDDEAEALELWVVSELHDASEYGSQVEEGPGGGARHHHRHRHHHRGGAFRINVRGGMRVEELRRVIRDVGGILPALQRLSYAGKNMEDSQRTLEHYGVAYWHARFPHWPIKIRKY